MLYHIKNLGLKFKCDHFYTIGIKKYLKLLKNIKTDRVFYGGIEWWGSFLLNMAVKFLLMNSLLYGSY
jgi:hypothetical protein